MIETFLYLLLITLVSGAAGILSGATRAEPARIPVRVNEPELEDHSD
jgi:hypothetical protein